MCVKRHEGTCNLSPRVFGLILAAFTAVHCIAAAPPESRRPMRGSDKRAPSRWLKRNVKMPGDYIVELYKSHDVVIFGEAHNVKKHKDFVAGLLPRLYHEAEVRCIGWEFSAAEDNDRLHAMVTAESFDDEALLAFARDQMPDWNSKEHWELIKAVWRLNKSLDASQEPMLMYGLSSKKVQQAVLDLPVLQARGEDSKLKELIQDIAPTMDRAMADQAAVNILERDKKGLLFVGRCHDMTLYEFPPEMNYGRPIMGNVLHKKYGDRVFHVWLYSRLFPQIERAMQSAGLPKGAFTVAGSPFAAIKSKTFIDARGVELKHLAQSVVYLGPMKTFKRNTAIVGYVTDEMFKKYREYYEADYGRKFKNALEVDKHLRARRWP